LDAKTGASIFQLPTGTPVFSSLAIARGILYYGNFSGKLTALDLTTQKPIWVFESEASKENAPAITNADGSCNFEKIFSSPNPFYDDMVVAVGKLLSTGSFLSSPVVVENVLYIGSTDGNLYTLM
jgi:outer membrane protein assembly factor BamB